jgi:hypothetical protein
LKDGLKFGKIEMKDLARRGSFERNIEQSFMTSNRPLEDWGKLLSDVPTAGAILDRFLHHAITLPITGRSYRIKDSLPTPAENKKAKKTNEPLTAGAAS